MERRCWKESKKIFLFFKIYFLSNIILENLVRKVFLLAMHNEKLSFEKYRFFVKFLIFWFNCVEHLLEIVWRTGDGIFRYLLRTLRLKSIRKEFRTLPILNSLIATGNFLILIVFFRICSEDFEYSSKFLFNYDSSRTFLD